MGGIWELGWPSVQLGSGCGSVVGYSLSGKGSETKKWKQNVVGNLVLRWIVVDNRGSETEWRV